jgi:glycosyltransferase involved in cell wall biosynthesis
VIKQLKTIVERRQPDIIQTHMIKSHFLVKLAGLRKMYPWVAYHHGYTATDAKMRVYNKLNRWSLPSATRVITVCDAFAKQLSENGVRSDRIAVRHNAVVAPRELTKDARQALKDEIGIASDDHVMLAVGRLSREKGHDDLIQAVATLRDSDSALKLKLVIVGDGPERSSLQQAVSQHGLDDQVIFIGHVGDVAPYYAITDVLALPSHSEGSPNVLLEAMAAGIPTVATGVGGVPEIAVSEQNSLIVPPHQPQLFADALHRVLTNPELACVLGANARAHVATHFSPESYAQSLIKIYEELLPKLVSEPGAVTMGSYTQGRFHDPVAIPTRRDSESLSA